MKNQYVPKTLSEFLGESNSITLKRKYGERPNITAGTHAPLRNQVLSFVSESGSVSKRDLKQYIMGLKEGGSTVAAANMFIKRNARYFLSENKNGITYFKLSNLGKRLVNQFMPMQDMNVSESFLKAKKKLSSLVEESKKAKRLNELEELEDGDFDEEDLPEDNDIDDMESDENIEAEDFDDEGPADEVDFDEDRFEEEPEEEGDHAEADNFEYEEDDEKITLTYYKNGSGVEDEFEDEDELEGEELPEDELEGEELPEDELEEDADRPVDEPRKFDFQDKGRPGVYDMDE